MSSDSVNTQLFQFIQLRSPEPVSDLNLSLNYIHDDLVEVDQKENVVRYTEADISSRNTSSRVGEIVFHEVFNNPISSIDPNNVAIRNKQIVSRVIGTLPSGAATLPDGIPEQAIAPPDKAFRFNGRLYFFSNEKTFLIPEHVRDVPFERGFGAVLEQALTSWRKISSSISNRNPANDETLQKLDDGLRHAFGQPVTAFVLNGNQYSDLFQSTKRVLFDALYTLYVLRRVAEVDFSNIIEALRFYHVLDRIVVSDFANQNKLPRLVSSTTDVKACMTAIPVIHPIFARLMFFRFPFNDVKPIGIGDLKVVKQKLISYQAGEIAYVETVLKSEKRERTFRTLDRSEDTFSSTSSSKDSTTRDLQSTDRFELKREVENVVKNELSLGANLAITYNGVPVVANLTSNFSYKHDQTETNKTAGTLSRDVVSKAVQQVERNVSESRTSVQISEKEEQTKHTFDNSDATAENISGIYRWLDKKYKAQLYNYGRRMMFEFIIPEPAAFLVESRIRQFEIVNAPPVVPEKPVKKTLSLGFVATDISKSKFEELAAKYDLSGFAYPPERRHAQFVDTTTGSALFTVHGADSFYWQAYSYACNIGANGYSIETFRLNGRIHYWGADATETISTPDDEWQRNTLQISVDGQTIFLRADNSTEHWIYNDNITPLGHDPFLSDDVSLTFGFFDLADFNLSISATLVLSPDALSKWRNSVYDHITKIELENLRQVNDTLEAEYQQQLAEYNRSMADLKNVVVNDLLQGGSSDYNKEMIQTELKKHCLTMLTKEYDSDTSNDLISNMHPTNSQVGPFDFHALKIETENQTAGFDRNFEKAKPGRIAAKNVPNSVLARVTTLHFANVERNIDYPVIDIPVAKAKGRHIQFLEQAFDWQQLASIFYPYFWADQPKWIEMMNRLDKGDPNLTTFLRAGSVRILIPVTPGYENAILHYLATREPWDGGPSPIIGDPLFIPLYEEIHKQQDDIFNATPEGEPWTFTLPTAHVYLEKSSSDLPKFDDNQS